MITNNACVITGLQPWATEIGSNCKNISVELSKNRTVLYVDYPDDMGTVFNISLWNGLVRCVNSFFGKVKIKPLSENLFVVSLPIVLLSINWIKVPFIFDALNKLNGIIFAAYIKKSCKIIGITNFWHLNDNDIFRGVHLKRYLKPLASYYYSRDNLIAVPYWTFHGRRLEPILIRESDAVFANSLYLAEAAKKYNPNTYYVGQGCETEFFDGRKQHPVHPDTIKLKKPVIGYTGVLYSLRLNIEWLVYLAQNRPNFTLCLVGPEDDDFKQSELHRIPNVVFIGKKKPEELPSIIASFDVCINPQKISEVTIGNYPRKIDEYLAMGKPTVALNTLAMAPFKDHVLLCNNEYEFLEAIEHALLQNTEELQNARISYAMQHTWEASVKQILYCAENISRC